MSSSDRALRGVDRDVAAEVRAALRCGWSLHGTGRHLQLRHSDGVRLVTVARTPSDHRSLKNLRAQLRRPSPAPR